MKVLFFYQHYWPDSPPYADILRTIGEGLVDSGHEVSVITSLPSYKRGDRELNPPLKEENYQIPIRRLRRLPFARKYSALHSIQKMIFPLRAFGDVVWGWIFRKEKIDVVLAGTMTPILNGLFGFAAAKLVGAKFIYHIQDIYPEVGVSAGFWGPNSLLFKILLKIDVFTCRHANVCVVLSDDMKDTFISRGVKSEAIVVINNFKLASREEVTTENRLKLDRPYIIFAGNLGRFQGLDLVVKGYLEMTRRSELSDGKPVPFDLVFLGEGVAKKQLLEDAGGHPRIVFMEHQPYEIAEGLIVDAEAGIVSVEPEIYKFAYPSKTLTYLGLGVPLFAIVESQSRLAIEIEQQKIGVVSVDRSVDALATGLEELGARIHNNEYRQADLLEVHEKAYSPSVASVRWVDLINKLNDSAQPDTY